MSEQLEIRKCALRCSVDVLGSALGGQKALDRAITSGDVVAWAKVFEKYLKA